MPSCFAFGCANSNKKEECKDVRFYRIPSERAHPERRRLWLHAIRRKGEPYGAARICSAHFVSGAPSKPWDKENPDYVPSLFNFPKSHQSVEVSSAQKLRRYQRSKSRQPLTASASANIIDDYETDFIAIIADQENDDGTHESSEDVSTDNSSHNKDMSTQTSGAEGHTANLRVIIDMLMEENSSLKDKVEQLENEVQSLKSQQQGDIYESVVGDEGKFRFYTGLPSVAAFLLVLRLAMMVGFSGFKAMTAENTLLVILMKLKMGLRNRDIAYRFRVPVSYVSTILSSRLCHVAAVGRQLIQWPSKEAVQANMPSCFLACGGDLRRTRVIVDCFEIFTERPKVLTARAQMWSNYKSHSTVKVLIGISPAGAVTFVSDVWGGRATDKAITLDGNLIDLVEPYDVVLADRGFLVRDEFAVLNVKVVTPHFTRGRKQMTRKEVQESRRISRVRIHVERVIGRVRRNFRILNDVLPLGLVPQINNIVVACCGLTNLHGSVVT